MTPPAPLSLTVLGSGAGADLYKINQCHPAPGRSEHAFSWWCQGGYEIFLISPMVMTSRHLMGRGTFLLVLIVCGNVLQQTPVREELSCVDLNEQCDVFADVCVSINQQWVNLSHVEEMG